MHHGESVKLKAEMEIALQVALSEAARLRHEFAGLEHLLYALCHDPETLETLQHSGADVPELKSQLEAHLNEGIEGLPEGAAIMAGPTLGIQRVIQRAAFHCQNSGSEEVAGPNVLVAMYAEPDSLAVSLLENMDVTRLDVVAYISHQVSRLEDENDEYEGETESPEEGSQPPGKSRKKANPLKEFCTNLTQMAIEGGIDPLVGRSKELERATHILARRRKNNPILVGESGVGKTAIVEGIALMVAEKRVPPHLENAQIYALDMGTLLAGTRFRGDFENRMKDLLKAIQREENAILFLDEIHMLIGAGASSGSPMDASNLIKPALTRGKLRCIGTTTYEEFRNYFEKDRALARRFQKIDVLEPSAAETVQILEGLRTQYEEFHGIRFTSAGLKTAAELAHRHLHDRKLPDKAIDLIDEAAAAAKLKGLKRVGAADIERVVASIAQIPPKRVSRNDKTRLAGLEGDLKAKVFGQDAAIEQLANSIKLSRAGLRDPQKPIGAFLFTGPTGVGKTEAARQLSETMGIELIRMDMSEYMERHTVSRLIGAPPGYVGFDQGGLLTEAVNRTPHAVLLLDEIEKAHPDVFNLLLQVMDHGTLTDNNGKKTDFRHVILIMTSNIGARDLQRRKPGFAEEHTRGDDGRAYRNFFSPEFRNRLDARIPFSELKPEVMGQIVDKLITELVTQLSEKKIKIILTPAARNYLAEKGFDPQNGARPLARVIQDEIKSELSDEILFGQLQKGGGVTIGVKKGSLSFSYPEPS